MSSILLIQSDPAVGADYCERLGRDPTFAVMAAATTLQQARAALARRTPDLIIGDLRLPDGPLVHLLDGLRPDRSHVVAIAPALSDPQLMQTLRHGADAFVLAGRASDTLLALARQVLAGESPLSTETSQQLLGYFDPVNARPIAAGRAATLQLSRAEQQMLRWSSEGYQPHEIARGMRTSPQQVGLLMRSVYRRLHLDHRIRRGPPTLMRVK